MDPLTVVPSDSEHRGEVLGLQSHFASRLQSLHFSASGSSESSTPSELMILQSVWVIRTSGSLELQVS